MAENTIFVNIQHKRRWWKHAKFGFPELTNSLTLCMLTLWIILYAQDHVSFDLLCIVCLLSKWQFELNNKKLFEDWKRRRYRFVWLLKDFLIWYICTYVFDNHLTHSLKAIIKTWFETWNWMERRRRQKIEFLINYKIHGIWILEKTV